MHRIKFETHIPLCGIGIKVITLIAMAALSGSCVIDTKTNLCEASGRRCRPGQVCAVNQDACIDIGGCGDGITNVEKGEACDDGNIRSGDGCSTDCTSGEICGNGKVDKAAGEFCDDGNRVSGDGCSADCAPEMCGDSFVDRSLGEVCDDGNGMSFDGCRADCRSNEACGNGVMDMHLGEECEFVGPPPPYPNPVPNTAACNNDCTLPACGDGHLNPMYLVADSGLGHFEQCDTAGDSETCDVDCTPAKCGDGHRNEVAGEACDSGGMITPQCNGPLCTLPVCGDSFLNPGNNEICDAGGDEPACDSDCTLPMCGDNHRNSKFDPPGSATSEECDTAGDSPTCDVDCTTPVCGDRHLNTAAGEECDDNNNSNSDLCPNSIVGGTCKPARCGDGLVRTVTVTDPSKPQYAKPEDCDSGGVDAAGCDFDCTPVVCGDGHRNAEAGEVCDKGGQGIPETGCGGGLNCNSTCTVCG
jgi:cysteine-rich repeat protein